MLVLDTCVLIFDAGAPKRIPSRTRAFLDAAERRGDLACSDISLWEIALLAGRGRLDLGTDTRSFLETMVVARGITVLPITPEIASLSAHVTAGKDPADRLIVATAIAHRARLVTADRALRESKEVQTLW